VFRAKSINEIENTMRRCIDSPIKENEIFSYFDSLIKNSFSITPSENISLERTDYTFKTIAKELKKKLINEISS